jgi:hypothetical protein
MLREGTTKMTSKSKQLEDSELKELLLSHYTRAEEVIERAKSYNLKSGLPEELMPAYIPYKEPIYKKKYLNFIKDCTSEHNGKFYDMKMLKAAGFVSDEDTPLDSVKYPRRELFQLSRIKTSKGQFLRRTEMWYGLLQDGTERSCGIDFLDWWISPHISYVYADPGTTYSSFDPRSTESRKTVSIGQNAKIRVAKMATDVMFPGNEMGTLVYNTPYTKDTVYEMIKVARGAFDDHNNGCSLALVDESKSRNGYSVTTLEEFTAEPFDEIFKRLSQPAASINVKDLVDQLKSTTKPDLELESKPYG